MSTAAATGGGEAPTAVPRRGRSPVGPVALAVAGGLLAAGGATAEWVRRDVLVEVGGSAGVALDEVVATPGTAFAPQLLTVGVGLALAGLALLVVRGGARRIGGLVVALAGLAVVVLAGIGTVAARAEPGVLAAGPGIAALGGVAGLAGGLLATRRAAPRPALPSRYSIDESEVDEEAAADEWRRASVEPPEGR